MEYYSHSKQQIIDFQLLKQGFEELTTKETNKIKNEKIGKMKERPKKK